MLRLARCFVLMLGKSHSLPWIREEVRFISSDPCSQIEGCRLPGLSSRYTPLPLHVPGPRKTADFSRSGAVDPKSLNTHSCGPVTLWTVFPFPRFSFLQKCLLMLHTFGLVRGTVILASLVGAWAM